MKNKFYLLLAFAAIMFAGGCTSDEPLFPTSVSEENSVGCGPLAGFTLMAYCKPYLVLDSMCYDFRYITKALLERRDTIQSIALTTNPIIPTLETTPFPLVQFWPHTYYGALNATQTLLYKLGQRMGLKYVNNQPISDLIGAMTVLKELGYEVSNTGVYNPKEMISNICKNNRMYFQGGISTINPENGHFWVIDGCKYSLVDRTAAITDTIDIELYCHWGWYGNCDGYYSGEIFCPDPDPHDKLEYKVYGNFYVQSDINYDEY